MKTIRLILIALPIMFTSLVAYGQGNPNPVPYCGEDGPSRQPCMQPAAPATVRAKSSAVAPASFQAASVTASLVSEGTTSEYPPNEPGDGYFVVNQGSGLDTGCTFRSGGPLRVTLKIDRVVGATNGDGTLQNWQAMVQNGVVDRYATLTMPAYDVDFSSGERDELYFNGRFIGRLGAESYLTGENNVWKLNTFRVPIEYVRFGIRNSGGSPSPGNNEIEVRIDQANAGSGRDVWCTQLDWAALGFNAVHPVVMVHGNNSSGAFFSDLNFTGPFQQAGIPFDNSINMATDSIADHADRLVTLIHTRVREFGVKNIHVVAHSKGGLDVRDYLARTLPRLLRDLPEDQRYGILSLITLCTPHNGSAGANYVISAHEPGIWIRESDNVLRTFLASRMTVDRGTPDLRVDVVQNRFNPVNLPALPSGMTVGQYTNSVQYYAFSADANLDNSRDANGRPTIQARNNNGRNEVEGVNAFNIPWLGTPVNIGTIPGATSVVQEVYRLMGEVRIAEVRTKDVLEPGLLFPRPARRRYVAEVREPTFQLNDFLVTARSASQVARFEPVARSGANHASIARPDTANRVIRIIRDVEAEMLGSHK